MPPAVASRLRTEREWFHVPFRCRPASGVTRRAAQFARPILELLEDRLAPSATGLPDIVGSATIQEGQLYVLELDAAGRDVDHWTINWGDGSSVETVAGNVSQATHVFADGPTSPTI